MQRRGEAGRKAGRLQRRTLAPDGRGARGRQHERPAVLGLVELGGERLDVDRLGQRLQSREPASRDQTTFIVGLVDRHAPRPQLFTEHARGGLLDFAGVVQREHRVHQVHEEQPAGERHLLRLEQRLDAVVQRDQREHPDADQHAEPDQHQVLDVHPVLQGHDRESERQARASDREGGALGQCDDGEDQQDEIRGGDGVAGYDQVHSEDHEQPQDGDRQREPRTRAQPCHRDGCPWAAVALDQPSTTQPDHLPLVLGPSGTRQSRRARLGRVSVVCPRLRVVR